MDDGVQQVTVAAAQHDWAHLNARQVGRYAEYFVKMELTLSGFDAYTPEVDDKGIDFVMRRGDDRYYDVQVKAIRVKPKWTGYIFMPKAHFRPRRNLFVAVVVFESGHAPQHFLVPSAEWRPEVVSGLLVSRDYGAGLKSPPEWGITVSEKNRPELERYRFALTALTL